MNWFYIKEKLPPFDIKVKVMVPDLSYLMMGMEIFLPEGKYISFLRKNPKIYCCTNPLHKNYHDKLRWSNDAGYYATHWRFLENE